MIIGMPQTCEQCGSLFYSTAAEASDIRRGRLKAEDICPNYTETHTQTHTEEKEEREEL